MSATTAWPRICWSHAEGGVLLVLDNFETNLEQHEQRGGYQCIAPHWNNLLTLLVRELPTIRSRLLLTSRQCLAALLDEDTTLWISLGTLPVREAALFVCAHDNLRLLGLDSNQENLIQRLMAVSRGHPLISGPTGPPARSLPP